MNGENLRSNTFIHNKTVFQPPTELTSSSAAEIKPTTHDEREPRVVTRTEVSYSKRVNNGAEERVASPLVNLMSRLRR